MRHAKTVPVEAGSFDSERMLTDRGVADAIRVGEFILVQRLSIGAILSSPAKRARQTTELVIQAAGLSSAPIYDQRIYEAAASQLLGILSEVDSRLETVLLVGHNPGMEDLLRYLIGGHQSMSAGELACIQSEINMWAELAEENCVLKTTFSP